MVAFVEDKLPFSMTFHCPENTNPKQNLQKALGMTGGRKPPHKKECWASLAW